MTKNMFALTGKVAIVTGASSGIGRATAQLLDELGAAVIATDINEKDGAETAASFTGPSRFLRHDVTSESDWASVASDVEQINGRLDILVNNAGIMHYSPFMKTSLEEFRRHYRVNAESFFIGMQAGIPLMLRTMSRGDAVTCSIINVSSIYGQIVGEGFSAYSASKGAVRLLSKAVANEMASSGVRVNSLHPGGTLTNLGSDWEPPTDAAGNPISKEQLSAAYTSKVPLGRFGEASDMASAIAFLASDASSYMTGAEIVVDGGYTIR